ncbi:MAG: tetratricopeptide repeat protein [Bacteroidota bacterium]|nr:tetratricopeptide repeat protein [Bacteroidota bacterium]
MNRTWISIIVIFTFLVSQAQESQFPVIEQANQAYNAGAYQEAIDLYNDVLKEDYSSAALYYNLGNAYFKINDIPSAILNYEKALKLNPNDQQIQFNLNIANSQIVDKIEAVPDMFYVRWWKDFSKTFSSDDWARIAIGLYLMIILLAAVFIISRSPGLRRISFWAGLATGIMLIISTTISYQKYNQQINDKYAIIFSPTITVKSSPSRSSVDLFVIHEGTKVEITDQVEGWHEIRIVNGSIGWVPQNILKKI